MSPSQELMQLFGPVAQLGGGRFMPHGGRSASKLVAGAAGAAAGAAQHGGGAAQAQAQAAAQAAVGMNLMAVENCLCEGNKYFRCTESTGRFKQVGAEGRVRRVCVGCASGVRRVCVGCGVGCAAPGVRDDACGAMRASVAWV
jgi:hypothetical protein